MNPLENLVRSAWDFYFNHHGGLNFPAIAFASGTVVILWLIVARFVKRRMK